MRLNNNKAVFITIMSIWFAFNIAVIGTLTYFFVTHRVVFERIESEEVRESFREMKELRPEIHNKYRNNVKTLNDTNKNLRITFLKELIKPEPDYDSLKTLSTTIQDITLKISMNFYKEMVEMRKTLTTEEAGKFYGHQVKMMERMSRPPQGREDIGMPPEDPERGPREWDNNEPKQNRRKAIKRNND